MENPEPPKTSSPGRRILLLAAVVTVITTVLLLALKTDPWVSDPSLVRTNFLANYEQTMGPAQPPPLDTFSLTNLVLERTNNSVRITGLPQDTPDVRLLNYELVRIPLGGSFEHEGGKVELQTVGIGYGVFPARERNYFATRIPGTFFTPDGRLLTDEERGKLIRKHSQTVDFAGQYPKLRFTFEVPEDNDTWKVVYYQLFDARTKAEIANGFSWGGNRGQAYSEIEMQRWHNGPMELVMDYCYGPIEYIDIPAQVGEVIRYGGWELHLAIMEKGERNGTTSGGNYLTFRFNPDIGKEQTVLMFLGSPWAYRLPVDFEALGHDGDPLKTDGAGSSPRYQTITIRANPEDIKTIRARVYTQVRRLVFELPDAYGLPGGNEDVANLFDVKIPYLRIQNSYDFDDTIWNLVQMRETGPTPKIGWPAKFFPREYTNVTPRELLMEYSRLATNGPSHVVVDTQANEIHWEEELSNRMIDWLNKIFRRAR